MQVRNGIENLAEVQQAATPAKANEAASATTGQRQEQAQGYALAADQTKLSAASSQLAVDTNGDVRAEKVAGIQAAIKAGTYHVPASAVAQKLISSMLEPE